jgi:uncharacterized membrane protein YhaH (DUF805 family)
MEKQESNYNMIDWWKKVVFKNYANFQGRARRSEYWFYALGNMLIIIPFYALALVGLSIDSGALSGLGFAVYGIAALGTLIPSLAVAVRRLHDIDKSGWNYLFILIPIVGPILLLVWFFTEGNRFTNQYGDDPKNPAGPELEFTGQQ